MLHALANTPQQQEPKTMHRILLILTVLTLAARSQPSQPQAQPPIVVQVQMPPTPQRDFIGYLQALGPLIAVVVAVSVAFMQWHIQKQNLRQQRFAKRFEVYQAVCRFLPTLANAHGKFQRIEYDNFRTGISPAKFLFGPDVTNFIHDIHPPERVDVDAGSYGELRWLDVKKLSDPPGLDGDDDAQLKVEETFEHLERRAESVFGPYLNLHSDQGWIEQ
jgi:hypothetical protein